MKRSQIIINNNYEDIKLYNNWGFRSFYEFRLLSRAITITRQCEKVNSNSKL